jgi:hypothetical protein
MFHTVKCNAASFQLLGESLSVFHQEVRMNFEKVLHLPFLLH